MSMLESLIADLREVCAFLLYRADKQDSARTAAMRWLAAYGPGLAPYPPVYLDHDLLACQPIARADRRAEFAIPGPFRTRRLPQGAEWALSFPCCARNQDRYKRPPLG
jgi:hypothetical protein